MDIYCFLALLLQITSVQYSAIELLYPAKKYWCISGLSFTAILVYNNCHAMQTFALTYLFLTRIYINIGSLVSIRTRLFGFKILMVSITEEKKNKRSKRWLSKTLPVPFLLFRPSVYSSWVMDSLLVSPPHDNSTKQHWIEKYCKELILMIQNCDALQYTSMHCTILPCNAMYCTTVLLCATPYCPWLYCPIRSFAALPLWHWGYSGYNQPEMTPSPWNSFQINSCENTFTWHKLL